MSKNHPNDNMYSILGKLEALKPTPEEKRFALVKEIRESVEAKGSVLQGVDAVQARLAKQFASEGVVDTLRSKNYDRLSKRSYNQADKTKPGGVSVYNVDKINKGDDRAAKAAELRGEKVNGMAEAYNPVKAVKQCAKDYMEMNGYTSVDQLEAEDIESIGDDCQINYQDVCEILGCKLPDSLGPVKSYGPDEHGNIVDFEECAGCAMGECSVHGMAEGEITHKGGEKVPTKFGTLHKSKATVDTEKDVMTDKLTDPDADDSEPAVAKGRGRPKMDIKDRSQAKMPWGGKPPKDTYKHQKGSTVHKMSDRAPKGSPEYVGETMADATIRLERKLLEGHMIDESGETLDHILNRFKHEVRNFKQTGELEYGSDLYDALYDYYCDSGEMPYGTAKARDGDPVEWISNNLQSHLDGGGIVGGNPPEDMGLEREGIEGRMPPVDNIPGKDDLLKGKGRSYYEEEATMRDELNELARLAGLNTSEGNAFTGKLKNTAKGDKFDRDGKEYTDTSTLDEEPEMEGNAFSGAVADAKADGIQPGEKVRVGDKEYPVKEAQDLLQMMKIAGLDATVLEEAIEKATKKDLDDMEAQDREHEFGTVPDETDSELEEDTTFDECGDAHPEGDFNINTSMSGHGDKSVTVTATGDHAAELLQMLRIAGLGGGAKAQELDQEPEVMVLDAPEEMAEESIEVDEPSAEPVNGPKPEYKTMRQSTMNPGEGDNGEKAMHPDRPTFKNGDNALARPAMEDVLALETKLSAEYESIKKVS